MLNVVLITAIVLAQPAKNNTVNNDGPCFNSKKVKAEVLNAITVRLM